MTLAFVAKSVMISIIAALAAWLPMVLLFATEMAPEIARQFASRTLMVAFVGSFAIGLPVAGLAYLLAGRHMMNSAATVFIAANLAGVMLLLTSFVLGHLFGGFFFGVPSLIAANVFALLGWFWILKPMRGADIG